MLQSNFHMPSKIIPLQSFENNYQPISNLGSGSFGTVVLAKCRRDKNSLLTLSSHKKRTMMDPLVDAKKHLNCLVAIKVMNKKLNSLRDYAKVKEVKFILSIASHPSLIQIYELFVDNVNFQLHISMETMSQNLYQLMKVRNNMYFSPVTLKSILAQILLGIRHIHKHDFFHRDIKPENILVMPTSQYYGSKASVPPHRRMDNYVVKVADYGLARSVHNPKPYTSYVSTRWYRSPEILLRAKRYSKPVDIWAFGAVAVEAANFIPLFPGCNELDQTWRIVKVLGSPNYVSGIQAQSGASYPPLGGFWKEAETLAAHLGFCFPYEPGFHIHQILPYPGHNQLAEVIKVCLTWNPEERADANTICSMPYFRNLKLNEEADDNKSHPKNDPQLPVENDAKVTIPSRTRKNSKSSPSKAPHTFENIFSAFNSKMGQITNKIGHASSYNPPTVPANNLSQLISDNKNNNTLWEDFGYGLSTNPNNQPTAEENATIDQVPIELRNSEESEDFNFLYQDFAEMDNQDELRKHVDDDSAEDIIQRDDQAYSWNISQRKKFDVTNSKIAMKNIFDEDYNIADVSFGSGTEIKC